MSEKRCGGCHYGKIVAQDLSKRICYGAPPSAIQMPGPAGQQRLQMARPVVSVSDEACALYRGKDAEDVARDDNAVGFFQRRESESISETEQ